MNSPKDAVSADGTEKPSMFSSLKNMFSSSQGGMTGKPMLILLGLVVTIVVGSIIASILYWIIKKKVIQNQSYIIKESKMPLSGLTLNKCNGNKIPESANGKRFSFSFWIYIHNLDKNSGIIRHVLHRGDEKNAMNGSPSVFLDANVNKLHVLFDSTSKNPDDPANLSSQSADIQFLYYVARRGITVDYIPLQRWVHVGVVVTEDTNGGSISAYVDGELVKTSTTNKSSIVGPYTVFPKINNLALDRKGDVFVGGSNDASSGIGFSGLVSMIQFFNYDLNAKDMYNIYKEGPIYATVLGKLANALGIGMITNQYGVRNPIYKIDQTDRSDMNL